MTRRITAKRAPIREAARAAREALAGRLPARYDHYADAWYMDFEKLTSPALHPGAHVLDVGSGRRPALPQDRRPPEVRYVGLDLSAAELATAPSGSYDEIVVGDISRRVPDLVDRFHLVVSWQVLEHVQSMSRSLDNLRSYLKPRGYAVALLSGRYSVFGLLNLLLPSRVAAPLVARVAGRPPETVFPAYYDACYRTALEGILASWSEVRIYSAWSGAPYFHFSRPLQAGYLFYEEWAMASGRDDLATHYLLQLRK